jgi:hypothetical protein
VPVLASLPGARTYRTAYVSVGGRGSGHIHAFWNAAIHKLSQRLVTTPGEVTRQIMQQFYTKATFHPRLGHSAPERPKTLRVEPQIPFRRRPNPLGLTRGHPTNRSPRLWDWGTSAEE